MNKVVMNIYVQVFCGHVFIFPVSILRNKIIGAEGICLTS